MLLLIADHVQRLWNTWNIRGLIILSLFLQSFLVLFAPLRKQRGGKWIVMIPLWIAYLLADWVATFTIGLMLRAEHSDILAFWAPFLLLHLGGPDTITSFSLEDNEFWIRHLLGLMLQVGSTIYIILQSLTHNKLWLPTLLVLIAGVIKYAERNRAFYLASFDHFGSNWAVVRLTAVPFTVPPEQAQARVMTRVFKNCTPAVYVIASAVYMVSTIKSLLVGPPLTADENFAIYENMINKDSQEMLQIIEIQLSLLYELLHTKLPVVDSKIGYICRTVSFGCILGALVSFSILLRKNYHNKFTDFDICLTYGLLIGALVLDLISIWLLMFSDWIIFNQYPGIKNYDEFIKRRRWSNLVPQLNVFDCHWKNKDRDYPNKLVDFLGTSSLFETIRRRIQCGSLEKFVEEQAWKLIFTTLQERYIGEAGEKILAQSRIFTGHFTNFTWTLDRFEHTESLLIWHIATELCYRSGRPDNSSSSSSSKSNACFDHREICKLISDYMFYLLVMEPTMIATSPNYLKIVFEAKNGTWKWPSYCKKGSKETLIEDLLHKRLGDDGAAAGVTCRSLNMLKESPPPKRIQKNEVAHFQKITLARFLAKELLQYQPGGCTWNLPQQILGRNIMLCCYSLPTHSPCTTSKQRRTTTHLGVGVDQLFGINSSFME
ncbi:hypothetical protein SLEP1_g3956 [Rubroshorea leprosula]|uniref:DUF4220 domain-containing protein n=1 Tax=Rubroshorea leprosula TaxID=152421 RepID=A0AAV5HSW7_9ROSI|nr:hypothetical protein SLEP1_g3956 [Rubroshorea leprosula]